MASSLELFQFLLGFSLLFIGVPALLLGISAFTLLRGHFNPGVHPLAGPAQPLRVGSQDVEFAIVRSVAEAFRPLLSPGDPQFAFPEPAFLVGFRGFRGNPFTELTHLGRVALVDVNQTVIPRISGFVLETGTGFEREGVLPRQHRFFIPREFRIGQRPHPDVVLVDLLDVGVFIHCQPSCPATRPAAHRRTPIPPVPPQPGGTGFSRFHQSLTDGTGHAGNGVCLPRRPLASEPGP